MTAFARPALVPELLISGDAEPVVVTDFLRFSDAPRLSHVLAGEACGHPVFAVDPVADLIRCREFVPLDDLAAGYGDEVSAAVSSVAGTVVIGYCAAAALALRIAARLAGSARVRVILAQPTWPDTAMIGANMAGFRADLGASDGSPDDLDGDPGVVLRRLDRALRTGLSAVARARGLDSAAGALSDLLDRYQAWLGFLLASRAALESPQHPGVPVDVVTGASGVAVVPGLEPGSYPVTRLALPDDQRLAAGLLARSSLALIGGQRLPGTLPSGPEG